MKTISCCADRAHMLPAWGLILLMALFSSAYSKGDACQSMQVRVNGLRSNDGLVRIALYDQPDGFPREWEKVTALKRCQPKEKQGIVTFDCLKDRQYAIVLYHDENNNSEMDSNFLGLPKEGYGFSNNAKGKLGPPNFADAAFHPSPGGIDIDIQYLHKQAPKRKVWEP